MFWVASLKSIRYAPALFGKVTLYSVYVYGRGTLYLGRTVNVLTPVLNLTPLVLFLIPLFVCLFVCLFFVFCFCFFCFVLFCLVFLERWKMKVFLFINSSTSNNCFSYRIFQNGVIKSSLCRFPEKLKILCTLDLPIMFKFS